MVITYLVQHPQEPATEEAGYLEVAVVIGAADAATTPLVVALGVRGNEERRSWREQPARDIAATGVTIVTGGSHELVKTEVLL